MPKQTFYNLPEEKRLHIESCAIDEFHAYGHQRSSINRIVEAAGIAKGSFYQYFEDKDDLFEHIVSTYIADKKMDTADVTLSVEQLAQYPMMELYRAFIRQAIASISSSNPKTIQIALNMVKDRTSDIYQRLMEKYQPQLDNFYLHIIEAKKATGDIAPEVDSKMLNYMLLGLIEYLIDYLVTNDIQTVEESFYMQFADNLEFILQNGIFTENGK